MALTLDGPRQPPARGGRPEALVVLLHGYGSNGDDLIALAPYWAKTLAGAQFVAPHAPSPVPGYPGGRQWFPITQMDPHRMAAGADAAAPGLHRFLDREQERYGLSDARTVLVGFSQGAMMALHVGLRRRAPPAAVVGFSGALVAPDALPAQMTARPPVLLVHGDRDDMVPFTALFAAADGLAKAGHGAEFHVSYGAGHTIAPDGLERGGAFIAAALAGRFAGPPLAAPG